MLEVGTGFHPELTGRENIYLNGTILGMSHAEVTSKLDEIVEFAEMSKFIDTPVKRYSSGMTVRLAFAVAAHLEPEILVVDEVLAVGDIAFQKKCLGKMQDVAGHGRTVLFVSHNMVSMEALCNRAILIDYGAIKFDGAVSNAIKLYRDSSNRFVSTNLCERTDRVGTGPVRLNDYWITDENGNKISVVTTGQKIKIHIQYDSKMDPKNIRIGFNLYESEGYTLINFNCVDTEGEILQAPISGVFVCEIDRFPLRSGSYYGNIFCRVNGEVSDWIKNAISVNVQDGDYFGTGKLVEQGRFVAQHKWDVLETEQ